jgi:hypothetical protein
MLSKNIIYSIYNAYNICNIPYIYQYNTNILYYIIRISNTIYTQYTNYTHHNYYVRKLAYFLYSLYTRNTSGIGVIFGIVCQPFHFMRTLPWYTSLVLYQEVI